MLKLELQHLGALLDALAGQERSTPPFAGEARRTLPGTTGRTVTMPPPWTGEHYTAKAPKDLLFPQVENLLRFRQQGKKLDLEAAPLPTDPVIAFGVRGCDIAGFAILDKVFLQEPADACYRARRENLTILGLACSEPEETCFCRTFGLTRRRRAVTWTCGWQKGTCTGRPARTRAGT
jgi:hypothetical protein